MSKLFNHLLCVSLLSICCSGLNAQLFYNNGAQITINNGGILAVKTADAENANGDIDVAGYFLVEGSLTNGASLTGNGASTGLIEVTGDWFNNSVFDADQSTVLLSGANQLISGSVTSNDFYNLTLSGTGIKTQTTEARVSNQLDLTSVELATDFYDCVVVNTNPNAILRTNGFVSSLANGALYRNTQTIADYLFPVGSSVGTFRYRPVVFTPEQAGDNRYGVRLVNNDPNLDALPRIEKEDTLCAINPNFYHHLYRVAGNSATDLAFYFDETADGNWTRLAHWQNVPQWEDMGNPSTPSLAGQDGLAVTTWDDFGERPFALAHLASTVDAGPDQTINAGDVAFLNAVYSGNNISVIDWTPNNSLNCFDCLTPEARPFGTSLYNIEITDDLECKAIDSVLITIIGSKLLIPDVFSPNGDAVNDGFKTLNPNLDPDNYSLTIYNRWGDQVFASTDPNEAWDGIYNNVPQDIGVFIFWLDYQFVGETQMRREKGNVTLVR